MTIAKLLVEEGWRLHPGRFAARLDPTFERYPHSDLIAREYVNLVTGRHRKAMVFAPPQHGKSHVTSRYGPAWVLEMFPRTRLIMASYAHLLAAKNSRFVRNLLIEQAGLLSVRLADDSQAKDDFSTTEGGGLLAVGVGGPITGNPADGLIIDDPFKNWQEAASEVVRENVWEWYLTSALTRVQDDGWQLLVMTRWHEDDLAGRLLDKEGDVREGGQWHVIRLPAIAEPTTDDPDPLGRREGEALCEARFSLATLKERQATMGSYLWAGLYQQRPAPAEGGILKRSWWRWYEAVELPKVDAWLISWDMSFKDADDSSFVVGQVWARMGARKYLMDQVRERMDFPATKLAVRNLAQKWPQARTILVEDKANGPAIIAELRDEVSGLIPVKVDGSKVARVHAVSGDIESGNVFLPSPKIASWIGEFVDECAAFPNGTNDDQVDAMSQALARWSNANTGKVGVYRPARILTGAR